MANENRILTGSFVHRQFAAASEVSKDVESTPPSGTLVIALVGAGLAGRSSQTLTKREQQ